MIVIDGDYPMAYGAMVLNRDLTLPIDGIRSVAADRRTMSCLPTMRCGRIAAAVVKICQSVQRGGCPLPGHRSGEQAYTAARADLAYYQILQTRGHVRILRTRHDLQQHIDQLLTQQSTEDLPVGLILGIERANQVPWRLTQLSHRECK